jgi:hypothetical protein
MLNRSVVFSSQFTTLNLTRSTNEFFDSRALRAGATETQSQLLAPEIIEEAAAQQGHQPVAKTLSASRFRSLDNVRWQWPAEPVAYVNEFTGDRVARGDDSFKSRRRDRRSRNVANSCRLLSAVRTPCNDVGRNGRP